VPLTPAAGPTSPPGPHCIQHPSTADTSIVIQAIQAWAGADGVEDAGEGGCIGRLPHSLVWAGEEAGEKLLHMFPPGGRVQVAEQLQGSYGHSVAALPRAGQGAVLDGQTDLVSCSKTRGVARCNIFLADEVLCRYTWE
jgi:hypothetical protein